MTSPNQDSASPAEQYLEAWHQRHADASHVFKDAHDSSGRSSYQRLASLASGSTAVLDVACGTGHLLSLIAAAAGSIRVVGVDLSLSELKLARARLAQAELYRARAQALPLADSSFDVVLCHMALMLMDDPEHALAECRRVLRRGGTFSAITNRSAAPGEIAKTIIGALRPRWVDTDAALRPPPIGDTRTLATDALLPLVRAHFDRVVIEPFAVTQNVPRRELWQYLVNSIYGLDAIPTHDGEEILNSVELPEPVPWTVDMIQVQGRA